MLATKQRNKMKKQGLKILLEDLEYQLSQDTLWLKDLVDENAQENSNYYYAKGLVNARSRVVQELRPLVND